MELIGPYVAACLLLTVAGVVKAVRPMDTARAVAAVVPLPLAATRGLVRAGAVAEAVVGTVALARPTPVTAGLVALSYLGFAAFVAVVLARGGPLATCGCFGKPDTPATRLHVVVNLVLAASAATVAATVTPGWLPAVLATQPWHGVPLLLVSLLCAWLAFLVLSRLAELGAARRLLGVTREPVA
ncbi:MAG TPA: MauE/DoxX family redox-associated membrane protein [Acidimicrobiales bacterium]